MAFSKGNKLGKGGKRAGSGRKPLATRQLCETTFAERIPLLAKIADNEAFEPRDRIAALRVLGSIGVPQQHEHTGDLPLAVRFILPQMPE